MRPRVKEKMAGLALLLLCAASAASAAEWSWSDVARVVSIADVHGAYDELASVLRATKLIDERGAWIGGAAHLVSTGDLLDRGADSRKVLDLFMRLVDEAPQSGGRVHVLLGNHEAMVLAGDRRYVNPAEYAAFRDDEPAAAREAPGGADRPPGFYGYLAAFSPEGRYGSWLLGRSSVIRIDGVAFVHGGLAPVLGQLDAEEVNRRLVEELRSLIESQRALAQAGVFPAEAELHEQVGLIEAWLPTAEAQASETLRAHARRVLDYDKTLAFSPDGPLWYRGTSDNPEPQERAIVDSVLERLGARMAVMGHTPTVDLRVRSRFDGRVVLADTGMLVSYYGGRAAALELAGGQVTAVYPAEGVTEPPRPIEAPAAEKPEAAPKSELTDAEIEDFLAHAPVVASKEVGTGITNPKRLTLRDGTREMRAIFKTIDAYSGDAAATTDLLARINQSDRWRYEIAAYKIDRMLGLGLVPVAVERTFEGKRGAAQLWIENAIDEQERAKRGISATDPAAFDAQFKLMRIFDALIYNEDRNQTNVLYTPADWKVHAIDHSRAFRTRTSFPIELRGQDLTPSPELAQRLAALDAKSLKAALGDLLEPIQIQALLKRRDQILRKKRRPLRRGARGEASACRARSTWGSGAASWRSIAPPVPSSGAPS